MRRRYGVVIPVGEGREDNLHHCLNSLVGQVLKPSVIAVVCDGFEPYEWLYELMDMANSVDPSQPSLSFVIGKIDKHEPGSEQPRNQGVRWLSQWSLDYVWFVDSDVIVAPDCLQEIDIGLDAAPEDRIMACPYEWLPAGTIEFQYGFHNDPRAPTFTEHGPDHVLRADLGAGLACWSGNLVWPLKEFYRVGGFWNELHHGRCEDGELGLRATAMGVPISFAPRARGWHLHHSVNTELIAARNSRDVPMLRVRHPWVEGNDIFVVDKDGKRFDVKCYHCGEVVNTNKWWEHSSENHQSTSFPAKILGKGADSTSFFE